jgi:hypothetical protein
MTRRQTELTEALNLYLPKHYSVEKSYYSSNYHIIDSRGNSYLSINTGCGFREYVVKFTNSSLNDSVSKEDKLHNNCKTLIQSLFLNFPPKPKCTFSNSLLSKLDLEHTKLPPSVDENTSLFKSMKYILLKPFDFYQTSLKKN